MTQGLFDTNQKKKTLKNRYELVFIYDSRFANPNGDPMENNELRIRQDKGFVTDTRLKRTIRDYLAEQGYDIFVIEKVDNNWKVIDIKGRLKETLNVNSEKDIKPEHIKQLIEKFIDIRLFGSAIKMKLTGAVQFNFGETMHKIQQIKVEWTTVFSSGENKWQWTFTEMFITPYSIIAFHGVVNEKAAETTWMSEDDYRLLKEAIWSWTKNLITRSKFEQLPRLLIEVKFKEWVKTHIWELDKYIQLKLKDGILDEKAIEDISEVKFDFSKFVEKINQNKEKIEKIVIYKDDRVEIENLPTDDNLFEIKSAVKEFEI